MTYWMIKIAVTAPFSILHQGHAIINLQIPPAIENTSEEKLLGTKVDRKL